MDRDDRDSMEESLGLLWEELQERNSLEYSELVSLQVSQTRDLSSANGAAVLRRRFPELSSVPLFCTQEAETRGAPERMLRLLITFQREVKSPDENNPGGRKLRPAYLKEAESLRPDLAEEG